MEKRGAIVVPIVIGILCVLVYSNTTNESIKTTINYAGMAVASWLLIGSIYVWVHTTKLAMFRSYNWEFQKEQYLIEEYKKMDGETKK